MQGTVIKQLQPVTLEEPLVFSTLLPTLAHTAVGFLAEQCASVNWGRG